jgi:HSP20 family protein
MSAVRDLFPIKAFEGYFDQFEPFFGADFMPRALWSRKTDPANEWRPSADIIEGKDEFLVKVELPEVKKADVKVDVVDGMLRIRGERKWSVDQKVATVHRVEACYGKFMRSFSLPDHVDATKIRAESADGVLTVHLPKVATATPKTIEVAVR